MWILISELRRHNWNNLNVEQQFAWVETYTCLGSAHLGPLFLCPAWAVISRMNADVETLCLPSQRWLVQEPSSSWNWRFWSWEVPPLLHWLDSEAARGEWWILPTTNFCNKIRESPTKQIIFRANTVSLHTHLGKILPKFHKIYNLQRSF